MERSVAGVRISPPPPKWKRWPLRSSFHFCQGEIQTPAFCSSKTSAEFGGMRRRKRSLLIFKQVKEAIYCRYLPSVRHNIAPIRDYLIKPSRLSFSRNSGFTHDDITCGSGSSSSYSLSPAIISSREPATLRAAASPQIHGPKTRLNQGQRHWLWCRWGYRLRCRQLESGHRAAHHCTRQCG